MRHPPHFASIQSEPGKSYGKWIFFAKRGDDLTSLWAKFVLSNVTVAVSGVLGMTCPNSHLSPKADEATKMGVVSVFCEIQTDMALLHLQGIQLIDLVQYVSTHGKLICESCDTPPHKITTIVAPSTICLPFALGPSKWTMQTRNPITMPNRLFDLPLRVQSFAYFLGARYNDSLKCWYAPSDAIWSKLSTYFTPRDESVQATGRVLLHDFASRREARSLPGVCDPSPIYALFSLNVCFSGDLVTERMLALFQHIQYVQPDIICLQEMTATAAHILHPLLSSLHYQSASQLAAKAFGEMLYIRTKTFHILRFEQVPIMPVASMRRHIHVAHLKCVKTNNEMRVGTLHLETGQKGHELRQKQLEHLLQAIACDKQPQEQQQQCPFVCCGDFNLSAYEDCVVTDMLRATEMADAWEQTGGSKRNKHTWNARRNSVLQQSEFKDAPLRRFDRILFTRNSVRWMEFDLQCCEKVPLIDRHISDHFAVFGRFQLFTQSQPSEPMLD